MSIRRVGIQTVVATAGAAIFHDPLAGAGGVGNKGSLIPAMAQGVRIVCDKGTAAAIAAVDGLAAALTGRGDYMGFVVMGQNRSDVLNVTIPTDGALADGITGAGTGGGHGIDLIAVFALGRGGLLHLSAAGAELQQLAIRFAGSVADDDALPCVTE